MPQPPAMLSKPFVGGLSAAYYGKLERVNNSEVGQRERMTQKNKDRDLGKRGGDRKQSFGGSNLIWTLIAVAVAGLFAASLFGGSQEVQLSYSDLERLIRAAGAKGAAAGE